MKHSHSLAVVLLLAACSSKVDVTAEQQAILQVDRAWAGAAQSGNIDSIVAYWADDARVVQPGLPVYQGKAAIQSMVTSMLAIPGFHITWTPQTAVVATAGDLGYTFGVNDVTATGNDGQPNHTIGRYIAVWRKGVDGKWRCIEDISNSGSPAAGAEKQ